MKITANLKNSVGRNDIVVSTNDNEKTISIAPRSTGGSSVNGGELLFLSLATCFCNDIYREAGRRNIVIESIEVSVSGDFGNEGEPATNVIYKVDIESTNTKEEIADLIRHVDSIAEVHNTLRVGTKVILV